MIMRATAELAYSRKGSANLLMRGQPGWKSTWMSKERSCILILKADQTMEDGRTFSIIAEQGNNIEVMDCSGCSKISAGE